MDKPLKVVLSGSHGTGKTTLVRSLGERLGGRNVVVLPEVPRLVIQELGDPHALRVGNNTFERQLLILTRHLEAEYTASLSGADVVICDRALADHWVYTVYLFPEKCETPEGRLWEAIVRRWVRSYNHVILVPPEFPPKPDGVREGSVEFQQHIHNALVNFYATESIDYVMVQGDVKDRVEQCLEIILASLKKRSMQADLSFSKASNLLKAYDEAFWIAPSEPWAKHHHVFLHLVCAVSKIARYEEVHEHGETPDPKILQEALADITAYAIRFANIWGYNLSQLYRSRLAALASARGTERLESDPILSVELCGILEVT